MTSTSISKRSQRGDIRRAFRRATVAMLDEYGPELEALTVLVVLGMLVVLVLHFAGVQAWALQIGSGVLTVGGGLGLRRLLRKNR